MEKELEKRKREAFADWCVRLAKHIVNKRPPIEDVAEVLRKLSLESFIGGANVADECKRRADERVRDAERREREKAGV